MTDVLSLITLFKTIGLIEGKHLLFDQEFKLATDPRSLISGSTHYHKKQNIPDADTHVITHPGRHCHMWVRPLLQLLHHTHDSNMKRCKKKKKKEEELNFNLTFYFGKLSHFKAFDLFALFETLKDISKMTHIRLIQERM